MDTKLMAAANNLQRALDQLNQINDVLTDDEYEALSLVVGTIGQAKGLLVAVANSRMAPVCLVPLAA